MRDQEAAVLPTAICSEQGVDAERGRGKNRVKGAVKVAAGYRMVGPPP